MAKKSAPKRVEPEYESQDIPDEEPAAIIESGKSSISKADAVRDALAQGNESPAAGTGYIHSVYGIVMTKESFSSYKAQEKARQAKKAEAASTKSEPAKRGPKPKPPLVEGYVAPPEKPKSVGEPDILLVLEGIKELVSQFGADKVKRMVDIIG